MTPKSLGKVSVPSSGTPVQLTTDRGVRAKRVRFATVVGETGKVYLGDSTLNKATFAGVVKEFWPTGGGGGVADEFILEVGDEEGNRIVLADYWVDAGVNGEGLIVEYWEG